MIKAELFTLRGTDAIPFEKALEFANIAFAKTGVRPAFLLGVIAEESNLGENVGTGNWRTDMHPERDAPIGEGARIERASAQARGLTGKDALRWVVRERGRGHSRRRSGEETRREGRPGWDHVFRHANGLP